MKILSQEKSKVLAEQRGWSLEWAKGFVEGERYRRRRIPLTSYLRVGIDEYCQGFRAAYYERGHSFPVHRTLRLPVAR